MFKLYDYFRSSACYRVRIALNLKEISYQSIPIHLVQGIQASNEYIAINPQKLIPALQEISSQNVLTQSLAIIEYLEQIHPLPALLPQDPIARAKVRAFAQIVACDMHPLNNLRVLKYLKHQLQISDEQKMAWYFHWLQEGFTTLESLLKASHEAYCFGDAPTLADVCLVPQVYNALRFDFPLDNFPRIYQVYQYCEQIPVFIKAQPEHQPDAHAI